MRASPNPPNAGRTRSGLRLRLALLDLPKPRDLIWPGLVLALVAAFIGTLTWMTATGHRISNFPANRDCRNYGKGAWVCGPVQQQNSN